YSVSSDPNRANAASAQILLTIQQPFANHNGGQLQFGPDGYLYIGMGDVDNATTYRVPPTNPFVGRAGALPEIWAYGFRNPWRFSFDRETGDLWIGDVGQNTYEEVDLQRVTSIGGENYGWRLMEGFHCFTPSTNCNDGTLTLPIAEY